MRQSPLANSFSYSHLAISPAVANHASAFQHIDDRKAPPFAPSGRKQGCGILGVLHDIAVSEYAGSADTARRQIDGSRWRTRPAQPRLAGDSSVNARSHISSGPRRLDGATGWSGMPSASDGPDRAGSLSMYERLPARMLRRSPAGSAPQFPELVKDIRAAAGRNSRSGRYADGDQNGSSEPVSAPVPSYQLMRSPPEASPCDRSAYGQPEIQRLQTASAAFTGCQGEAVNANFGTVSARRSALPVACAGLPPPHRGACCGSGCGFWSGRTDAASACAAASDRRAG